jgi:hypothetical protein
MDRTWLRAGALALVAFIASIPLLTAQESPATGTPVHMVVTVEARHGADVPVIQKEDVMVYQGHDRVKTTDWIPLQGDRAELELFLLLDDAAGSSLGSQLEERISSADSYCQERSPHLFWKQSWHPAVGQGCREGKPQGGAWALGFQYSSIH